MALNPGRLDALIVVRAATLATGVAAGELVKPLLRFAPAELTEAAWRDRLAEAAAGLVAQGVLGPDHRLLVPASAIAGALFLSLCDVLTRLAFLPLGAEPPVGVLTALFGGPFFLVLLWRRRGERLF